MVDRVQCGGRHRRKRDGCRRLHQPSLAAAEGRAGEVAMGDGDAVAHSSPGRPRPGLDVTVVVASNCPIYVVRTETLLLTSTAA